jgi:type I restriction enzyme, S subunit
VTAFPAAWRHVRAKYLYRVIDERTGADELPLLAVSIHHGVVPRRTLTEDEPRADDLANYKRCAPGDVVLNRMRAFQGGIGVASEAGIVSPDYVVLRMLHGVDVRFFHHLFRSSWFVGEMTARLRGIGSADQGNVRTPRINVEDFGEILLALPPLDEQRRVAEFLDTETARIDALIEKKRRTMELLRERFVSVRRQAFDGLASSSGEISLRRCVRCLDGRRVSLNAEERAERRGAYPYWGAGKIVDRIDAFLFDEPLVLLGEDGAPFFDLARDVAFYVNERVWVNNHIHVLRPLAGWSPRFLMHMLNAVDFSRYITGSTRDKLTQAEMDDIRIPAASRNEQDRVVAQLDALDARGNGLRSRLDKQIDLLREHRQALITAAVTSHLDVTKAAA